MRCACRDPHGARRHRLHGSVPSIVSAGLPGGVTTDSLSGHQLVNWREIRIFRDPCRNSQISDYRAKSRVAVPVGQIAVSRCTMLVSRQTRSNRSSAVSARRPDMAVRAGPLGPSASLGSDIRRHAGHVVAVASPVGRLEMDLSALGGSRPAVHASGGQAVGGGDGSAEPWVGASSHPGLPTSSSMRSSMRRSVTRGLRSRHV